MDLEFRLPNREEPIAIGGEVRWVAASGVGVQFDGLRAGMSLGKKTGYCGRQCATRAVKVTIESCNAKALL